VSYQPGSQGPQLKPEPKSVDISPKIIIGAVIGLLALIFILQNTKRGRINLLFWHISAPAWLWLLILFAGGVVVGSMFPWLRKKKKVDDAKVDG
jgi:uncharacterized integral membrane protein